MERLKSDIIKELITTAQDNVWKNELALEYNDKFGEGKDKEEKKKGTERAIKKDLEYIDFLKVELSLCESLG